MNEMVVIYGGGDHGRVVYDALQELGLGIAGVVDELQPDNFPVKWLGPWEKACLSHAEAKWHVAIGDNAVRDQKLKEIAQSLRQSPLTIIHPQAIVSNLKVGVGPGSFVAAGAVLALNARLGPGVIVNHGATVDHDCALGRSVHIAPGVHLAGRVRVGDRTLLGVGSSVIPGIRIGSDVIVGAGSTVIEDIEDSQKVGGSPAKLL